MAKDEVGDCDHSKVVSFDEEASKGLSSAEIRKRWPRFTGTCPDCGFSGIFYASFMHYVSGDW